MFFLYNYFNNSDLINNNLDEYPNEIIPFNIFYDRNKLCNSVHKIHEWKALYNILISLDNLTNKEINVMLLRFRKIYRYINDRYIFVTYFYNICKLFIIIAGIINPALLSITKTNFSDINSYYGLFWLIWILQLLTSIITSVISFLKIGRAHV